MIEMIESNRLTDPAQSSSGQLVEALPSTVTTPIPDAARSDAIVRVEHGLRRCRLVAGQAPPSLLPFVLYPKSASVSSRRAFHLPPSIDLETCLGRCKSYQARSTIVRASSQLGDNGSHLADHVFFTGQTRSRAGARAADLKPRS